MPAEMTKIRRTTLDTILLTLYHETAELRRVGRYDFDDDATLAMIQQHFRTLMGPEWALEEQGKDLDLGGFAGQATIRMVDRDGQAA